MIQQKKGKTINISSIAGVYGSPMMAHYGAAKAGVIAQIAYYQLCLCVN